MKPDKRLADTKVYVNGKSKEIQEKAFQLGYKWSNKGAKVTNENYPFLFFMNGEILCSNDMDIFKTKGDKKEVSADYILSLEPEPEYSFRPFMKVLVRDHSEEPWDVDFFRKDSRVNINGLNTPAYSVVGGRIYLQCIPYRGNEHLAFTVTHDKA